MATLTSDDRSSIESLLTEFYWRLDHPKTSSVTDLFTEPGTIVTPRGTLSGRQQIDAWFNSRIQDAGRITQHSFSNVRITSTDPSRATVEAHVQTATRGGGAEAVVELMFGETTDVVVKGLSSGWRFESRRLDVILLSRLPGVPNAHEERHP
ncbi:MAG TPA: nuclear transport factor 2 family protein [Steroidobacteraceae bacterium]|nr:nuclear transport factor 2 family protein [Steroidobacteraceae bacterium]